MIVPLIVLPVMVQAIKPERGQVQLRQMVELHVLRLMEVIPNLAAMSVLVRLYCTAKQIPLLHLR